MAIYEKEIKNSKGRVPKEFSEYLEAYVWLKGEPKFGTDFLDQSEDVQEDILSVTGDVSTSGVKSEFNKTKITFNATSNFTSSLIFVHFVQSFPSCQYLLFTVRHQKIYSKIDGVIRTVTRIVCCQSANQHGYNPA